MKSKLLLLFIGLSLCFTYADGQITSYTRTPLTGLTYAQISGGTVINTAAALTQPTLGGSSDDGGVVVPLPFTFTYDGIPYTQVTFCTNGWICMNTTTASASQGRIGGNLFTTTLPNSTIAAWFGDGNANFTSTAGSAMVHGLEGTDIYSFEWRNASGSGFSISNTVLINFKISIYGPASTNPGRIELLYGSASAGISTGRTAGIENATGGTNNYINALDGLSNTTGTFGAWPGNGNGYRFDPPVPCTGVPVAGTVTPSIINTCSGQTVTLTSTGATSGFSGLTYQWQVSPTPGGPYFNVVGGTGANTTSYTSAPLSTGTYYAILKVKCATGPDSSYSNEVTVNVSPTPTASASNSGPACLGANINLTGNTDIGTSFSWTGPNSFTSSTQNPVLTSITPLMGGTYSFTAIAGTCTSAVATTTVTINASPLNVVATATPPSVCSNGSSQLNTLSYVPGPVNTYPFTTSTGATLDPMVGATQVIGTGDDDTPTAAPASIGFAFNYNGTYYTQYSVSPDGWILLGGATATSQFTNSVTSTTNIPKIYPYWDDVATGTTGNVKVLLTGTAPNRIFIVQWFVTIPRNTTGAANSTFQAWLYEADGKIEFRYGTMGSAAMSSSVGLTAGAANFNCVTISSNTNSTSVANNANAGQPASGRMYTFTLPPASNFAWTPTTFLSNPSIANPMATSMTSTTTYIVTASTAAGCSLNDTVTINVGSPLVSSPLTTNSPACEGTNFVATAAPSGGGAPYIYKWDYGTGQFTSPTATLTISSIPAGTYTLTSTVLDNCGDSTIQSTSFTINAMPVIGVTPTSALYCSPGPGVTLTGSGGVSYTWAPASGLSATSGTSVDASPAALTTYTVTGTGANSCTATATTVISRSTIPTASATATPSSICTNGSSTLIGTGSSGVSFTYCQPTYTTGTAFGDYISSVQLNTLSNSTGASATPYYTLYPASGSTTTTLVAGNSYSITLVAGTYTSNDIAAFIDYDQNGTLNNPGEKLGETDNMGASPASTTFNFTVPLTAINGTTRLRVREMDHAGSNDINPCTVQSSFGETEDYTITIVGGVDAVNFSWSPSTYLNTTTNDTAIASNVAATTSYILTVDNAGCTMNDTVTVNVSDVVVALNPVNIMCNGDSSGTFTLGAVTCGTAPFDYSVDGGAFGPIPTNLVAGTHSVIARDAGMLQSSPISLTITQPSWTPDVPTVTPSNVNLCVGDSSALFTIPSSGSVVIYFDVATSPIESPSPGTLFATATMPPLPGGSVVTSAQLTYANVNSVGGSWNSEVRLGTSGAINEVGVAGTGAAATGGVFTYTRPVAPGSINTAGGTVNLLYWESFDDFVVGDAIFPTGTAVASIVINYSVNGLVSADSVNWYDAAVGGTLLATNDSLEAVGTSVLPNTNTPGTYTFYAEGFYHGCTSDTRTAVTVVVGAYPVVNLGPDAAYCNNHVLDAGNPGLTYSWNDGSTNQTLNALDTATYWVDVTSAIGCTTRDSIDLVINPLPTVDLGPDTVSCGSYLLDPGPQPGTSTFLWNDMSTGSTLFTTTSGDYDVTVTDVNGCINSDTVHVDVPPITSTNIGPDTTLCTNDTGFLLDATQPGANTYVWQDGSTGSSFFVNLPGTYWVTLTNFVGCSYTDTIVVASVNPVQTNIDVNFITTSSATLDAGSGFTSYVWSTSATSQVITVTANGQYVVTVTDNNGCITTDTVNIVFSLGIFNPDGSTSIMKLYPNPSDGVFNLSIDNLETANLVAEVLDLNGKVVYNRVIGSVNGSVIEPFSLTDLRMGTYVLRLTANGKTSQLRFIIGK